MEQETIAVFIHSQEKKKTLFTALARKTENSFSLANSLHTQSLCFLDSLFPYGAFFSTQKKLPRLCRENFEKKKTKQNCAADFG